MSTTDSKLNQKEINDALWAVCDTFRGTISPNDYKDYILTMFFLKYISDAAQDHSDQYQKEEDESELIEYELKNERFVIPKQANFWSLYDARLERGNGKRIDQALHIIEEANPDKLKGVFQNICFNSNKLGDQSQKNDILLHLLSDFANKKLDFRPSRIDKDIIGNAYDFLIKNFAAESSRNADDFFTPQEVSDLLAELVDPQENEHICDPTAGSGSLLIKCGRKIQDHFNGSKDYFLYGQEAIGATWSLAKMNMLIHGEDNHRIECGDTISKPKLLNQDGTLKYFDIVVANPPFSLEKWGHEDAENDQYGRFHRGVPPKTKGDYAFILHMIETLKHNSGRMGVVVPHGVLFRTASEGEIRQKLIEENLLDVVIGLPKKLFYGTRIPSAILIFKKNKIDNNLLFIDASRDYKDGKNQNQLRKDDIRKIVKTYRNRQNIDKYAYLATFDEIKNNDFNLNISRYITTFEEEEDIDLKQILKNRTLLKSQLSDLELEVERYLKELGHISEG